MDFLILGHGLAGALLADALERRGNKPIVADASLPHAATPVAAGDYFAVGILTGITIRASILASVIPANEASKTYPAEALRYE